MRMKDGRKVATGMCWPQGNARDAEVFSIYELPDSPVDGQGLRWALWLTHTAGGKALRVPMLVALTGSLRAAQNCTGADTVWYPDAA